jgi:putative endonuclease
MLGTGSTKNNLMFFIYIIQSEIDNSFYIGFSENLENRIKEHNFGRTNYTSKKRPWELVYSEKFENKTNALKREKFLKRQRNKDFLSKADK